MCSHDRSYRWCGSLYNRWIEYRWIHTTHSQGNTRHSTPDTMIVNHSNTERMDTYRIDEWVKKNSSFRFTNLIRIRCPGESHTPTKVGKLCHTWSIHVVWSWCNVFDDGIIQTTDISHNLYAYRWPNAYEKKNKMREIFIRKNWLRSSVSIYRNKSDVIEEVQKNKDFRSYIDYLASYTLRLTFGEVWNSTVSYSLHWQSPLQW